MRFSERREEETHINLTPLIDVVFLLLIFFMVSTTFSKESQLRIRLPESSDQPAEAQTRFLEVEISADGVFAVRGPDDSKARELINTQRDTLRRALTEAAAGDSSLVTLIRADRRAPHESVIQVMDIARRLGYTDITFATQQINEQSSAP